MSGTTTHEPSAARPHATGGANRPIVEFLVVLLIGILFSRAFAAEAYIVPTGSMAPTLLGLHREYRCPSCGREFALGMDDRGRTGRPACPNCGEGELGGVEPVDCTGDRLLVQKHLFDLRPPRRWEVAVFQNPNEPGQAYVKRVVGLPGESILIRDGDIYADGRIARKTPAEQRAMRIPVYDNDFLARDVSRRPRWTFRRGSGSALEATGWRAEGMGFRHEPPERDGGPIDWLEYRHWQPDRDLDGPIRDYTPYNGADLPGENRVADVMIEADLAPGPGCRAVWVRLGTGADRFSVAIPCDDREPVRVWRDGREIAVEAHPGHRPGIGGRCRLEASWCDRRLTVEVGGRPLFEPIDCDDPPLGYPGNEAPAALGLDRGSLAVRDLRIYRDVYYTDALSNAPRRPFGVEVPYQLREGEYFVLGDNSPVSNDSRFWPGSPVVRADALIGKPFLVHLPSQCLPLEVFGHELYWIPDPRKIRYIR